MKLEMKTNLGIIEIELDRKKAPITTQNFLQYVEKKHYDETIFHRVIKGFMIQGGGFNKNFEEKETDKPIQNEADNGLTNDAFTISMARTNDPDSATSQFFINLENNDFLNHSSKSPQGWGYAVFGKVTKGIEVVEKIGSVKTGTKGFYQDVPTSNVIIEKVTVLNSNAKPKRN